MLTVNSLKHVRRFGYPGHYGFKLSVGLRTEEKASVFSACCESGVADRMTNVKRRRMTKTADLRVFCHSLFGFVSSFDIRHSDFGRAATFATVSG